MTFNKNHLIPMLGALIVLTITLYAVFRDSDIKDGTWVIFIPLIGFMGGISILIAAMYKQGKVEERKH